MDEITVSIEDGVMTIKIPVENPPVVSSSGKSKVIASSHGNIRTKTMFDGKPITIGLNAYVKI